MQCVFEWYQRYQNIAIWNGRQGRTRTYVVSNVRDLQSRAFATQLHLTIKIKDVLTCVYNLKVISNQAMPPNQFHRYNLVKALQQQVTSLQSSLVFELIHSERNGCPKSICTTPKGIKNLYAAATSWGILKFIFQSWNEFVFLFNSQSLVFRPTNSANTFPFSFIQICSPN